MLALCLLLHGFGFVCRVLCLELDVCHDAHDFKLDVVEQVFEQFEGFALVFALRVFLGARAQPDGLAQHVHRRQVLFPLGVDGLQRDVFFDAAHDVAADLVFFFLLDVFEQFDEAFFDLFGAHVGVGLQPVVLDVHRQAKFVA